MHRAAPAPIVVAKMLIREALVAIEAHEAVEVAQEAEAAHFAEFVAEERHGAAGARGYCPLLGACVRSCNCGEPQGTDYCSEVGRNGAGAKRRKGGTDKRLSRAVQAEAQQLAEAVRQAEEAEERARQTVYAVAGEVAGIASMKAVATHGEGQALAITAVLLGLPLVDTEEVREAAPAAAPIGPRVRELPSVVDEGIDVAAEFAAVAVAAIARSGGRVARRVAVAGAGMVAAVAGGIARQAERAAMWAQAKGAAVHA